MNTITLVGRNSDITVKRFPSGSVQAEFTLAVNNRNGGVDLFPCEAWGKIAERLSEMESGLLIGLIGSVTRDKKIRLDCLERLGPARTAS